jgi:hypothetical protein
MCTAMLFDPNDAKHANSKQTPAEEFKKNATLYERFVKIKQAILLGPNKTFIGWFKFLLK